MYVPYNLSGSVPGRAAVSEAFVYEAIRTMPFNAQLARSVAPQDRRPPRPRLRPRKQWLLTYAPAAAYVAPTAAYYAPVRTTTVYRPGLFGPRVIVP